MIRIWLQVTHTALDLPVQVWQWHLMNRARMGEHQCVHVCGGNPAHYHKGDKCYNVSKYVRM